MLILKPNYKSHYKYFSTSNLGLYNLLGVQKNASSEEIKKAYKKLALQHHPDRNPQNRSESEDLFRKISEAYQTLSDPQKRSLYDRFGDSKTNSEQSYNPNTSRGANYEFSDFKVHHMSKKEAEALFKNIFGGLGFFDMNQTFASRTKFKNDNSNENISNIFEQFLKENNETFRSKPFAGGFKYNFANTNNATSTSEKGGVISSSTKTNIIEKNGRIIETKKITLHYRNGQIVENILERDITPRKGTSDTFSQDHWNQNFDNMHKYNYMPNLPKYNIFQVFGKFIKFFIQNFKPYLLEFTLKAIEKFLKRLSKK